MPTPFNSELSAKARESTDAQRVHYKRDFLDDDHWKELARKSGVNMPPYYTRPSDTAIKATLRKLNISWGDWIDAFGWENAEQFEQMNPRWSMRPLTGLILELWAEKQSLRRNLKEAASYRGINPGEATSKPSKYPQGVAKSKRKPIKLSNGIEDVNS